MNVAPFLFSVSEGVDKSYYISMVLFGLISAIVSFFQGFIFQILSENGRYSGSAADPYQL